MTDHNVYMAHSWEEHEDVKKLATYLMENGINVWLDEWEIQAGESLRRKMESGLDDCEVFLVILTPGAMKSPWVQEEIDAGLSNRLTKSGCRFITYRSGVEIGELSPFLRSRLVPKIEFNESGFKSVLMTILAATEKPELGPLPAVATILDEQVTELNLSPAALSIAAYLNAKSEAGRKLDPHEDLTELADQIDIPVEEAEEAVDELEERGFVTIQHYGGGGCIVSATEEFFWATDSALADINTEADALILASLICNSDTDPVSVEYIGEQSGLPPRRVNPALNLLEWNGYTTIGRGLSSGKWVGFHVRNTPKLRRFVKAAR